ncbi:FAD-binding oxidoreductase [Wenzhouxiangella limi]|uniref:Delta(24)-sterol reductase n=2 Tax=Chromatiales TaxID=135613 RepID=A0A845UWY3_9GAMM|nr:FAD-binding oxidoreductase [Wenzhouxiangella limi]NDY94340.1 FAD-binding oxidoreductase [Wenzhouxiangella limi]
MSKAAWHEYRTRLAALSKALSESSGQVRLRKATSNLFRPREAGSRTELDVSSLNHVIEIDTQARVADVEGMTTYADLVEAALPCGLAPAVVPELKSITVGGAATGIGIESSSFRYGLVHDTVEELDVLVADGRVLTCSRDHNSRLFYGFPNSYGSLGYATRVRLRLIPVTPHVRLEHATFDDPEKLFAAIASECARPTCDYLDGVCFSPREFVLTRAYFVDVLPADSDASDYTWMRQYWRSLRQRHEDILTIHDYLWRWDTDWFWCSKNVGAHLAPVRLLLGASRLSSVTYQKIMRASRRWPLNLLQWVRPRTESVIQDVDIPIANAADFLADFDAQIGIRPVWICPLIVPESRFSLFSLQTDTTYINFGFWDMIRSAEPDGYYNARVEGLVARHEGKKSLYSRSTYDQETFWQNYDRAAYKALKSECDPGGRFPGLYEKAVQRQ